MLEIIETRLGPPERRRAFLLGDWDDRDFVGRVSGNRFSARRARRPGNVMTPILRGTVHEQQGRTSIDLVLVPHALTRIGVIAQIFLVLFIAAIGALAGLTSPIFFVGALFVLVIQVTIALIASFERRRTWPELTHWVCAAVAGELRPR